jgi:hypothetical protein
MEKTILAGALFGLIVALGVIANGIKKLPNGEASEANTISPAQALAFQCKAYPMLSGCR